MVYFKPVFYVVFSVFPVSAGSVQCAPASLSLSLKFQMKSITATKPNPSNHSRISALRLENGLFFCGIIICF